MERQSWLFPLMVVAAGTVIMFGCLGIGTIVGVLPLSRGIDGAAQSAVGAPNYYHALEESSARLVAQVDMAEAQAAKTSPVVKQPASPIGQ